MIDSDRVLKSESDCKIAAGGSPALAAHPPTLSVARGGRRRGGLARSSLCASVSSSVKVATAPTAWRVDGTKRVNSWKAVGTGQHYLGGMACLRQCPESLAAPVRGKTPSKISQVPERDRERQQKGISAGTHDDKDQGPRPCKASQLRGAKAQMLTISENLR